MFRLPEKKCLFQIVAIAGIYFLTGKLGQHISLPPGYASLIWAPFGLSIAALLLLGVNRWPGVFFGALLVNFELLFSKNWFVDVGISLGTSVSVVSAFFLIRKIIKYPKPIFSQREILFFLLLAGPVPAFINSVIGVFSLYLGGLLNTSPVFLNWLYWWIGDSIGGFVFSPLALILLNKPLLEWRKSLINLILPLAVFFGVIIGTLQFFNRIQTDKERREFENQAKTSFAFVERFTQTSQERLRSMMLFLESSQQMKGSNIERYADLWFDSYPEMMGLMWAHSNALAQKDREVIIVKSKKMISDGTQIDLILQSKMKVLLASATRTSKIFVSDRFDLGARGISKPCILLLAYSQKHRGFFGSIISLESIVSYIPDYFQDQSFRFEIFDASADSSPKGLIFSNLFSLKSKTQFRDSPHLRWQSNLTFGDKLWLVEFSRDSTLHPQSVSSNVTFLLMALSLTFITCSLMTITFARFFTVEELVNEKTRVLREINLQLENASRAKTAFLSNMSHEIRTPLNVLVGITEILDDSSVNNEKRQYLEIARRAGSSLLNIINDILDLAKIEAGSMKLESVDFDLEELVQNTFNMFALEAKKKNLEVSVIIDQDACAIYSGDPTRIRQILFNLISNAFKFTNQGRISLKVSKNTNAALPGTIYFEIADTGIGIPQDKLLTLFQPFSQVDSSITRKFGGTGLGLSICKRLSELMNGSIWCESLVNKGSVFRFTLDLKRVREKTIFLVENQAPRQTITAKIPKQLKILIVDDTDDNRFLLRAYLKGTPHELLEAENGEVAVDAYKKHHPDLVLMDMQMPVMDGCAATIQIRDWERQNSIVPAQIWAITAYALKEEINKSFQAGCDLHLTKPLRKSDLLQRISDLSI